MRTSQSLQLQLSTLIGDDVFRDGVLQKSILAAYLLRSEDHVQAVNAIIHPVVAHDFEQSGQAWLESAILFDSGFDKRTHIDKVVCVTAPEEVRIHRVMVRDGISRDKTLEWIARQLPQEEVLRRSDYEIINDGIRPLAPQVDHLLSIISE